MIRLTLALLLVLLPVRAHAAGQRWLAAHVDSAMGLGDQLHLHDALLLLAGATQRTAVLPPLAITVTDFGALAGIDPADTPAFDAGLDRALAGRVRSSANLPQTTRFVPIDGWFDVGAIAAGSGVRVATFAQWHAATNGRIDWTLVPSTFHGCLPDWSSACTDAKDGIVASPPDAELWGERIRRARVACVASSGDWTSAATGSALVERLRTTPVGDAATVALDGFCLRMPLGKDIEARRPGLRGVFRPSPAITARVDAFRREHHLKRYLALHWRRGDVVVDHRAQFLGHTPENVAAAVKQLVERERLGPFDGVVLLTDAFSKPELARMNDQLVRAVGAPVVRWDAAPDLSRSFAPERQVDDVIMDLALGMNADVVVGTFAGSNFFNLMASRAPRSFALQLDTPPLP